MDRIVDSAIDVARLLETWPTLVVGTVRHETDGWKVRSLFLDHHPVLTNQMAHQIEHEASRRYGLTRARFVHRVGRLEPGDVIVCCAADAPEWERAMEATRWMLEAGKHSLPIWKREEGPLGERWVPGRAIRAEEPPVANHA